MQYPFADAKAQVAFMEIETPRLRKKTWASYELLTERATLATWLEHNGYAPVANPTHHGNYVTDAFKESELEKLILLYTTKTVLVQGKNQSETIAFLDQLVTED